MAPLIIIMYALWASSFAIAKELLSYAPPLFVNAMRLLVGGGILVGYQHFYANHPFNIRRKDLFLYGQIIILGMLLSYSLRFWGLSYVTSSKTAFLFSSSPFFAAIYSYFYFQERLSLRQWLSLLIGFIGLIPVLITSSTAEQSLGELFFISTPEIAILLAVALHSYGWILIRALIHAKKQSTMFITGFSMLAAGLLALPISLIVEGIPPLGCGSLSFVGWLGLTILISNVICYNLYGYLLKHYSATFLSFSGFLSPLFAAFYGWAFLKERITWHFLASMAIIFIALYIFYQEEPKRLKNKAHSDSF